MSHNVYDKATGKLVPIAGNSGASAASLEGLSDVAVSSPADGQILRYDAENNAWLNDEIISDPYKVEELSDALIVDIADKEGLVYDATLNKWVNKPVNYLAGDGITIHEREIAVKDRLIIVKNLPIADAALLGQARIYLGSDSSLQLGGIYQCQQKGANYEWVLISAVDVDLNEYSKTWTGTMDAWNELPLADKEKYEIVNLTDDVGTGQMVVDDIVTSGSYNPVSSNAVANALGDITDKLYVQEELLPDNVASDYPLGFFVAHITSGAIFEGTEILQNCNGTAYNTGDHLHSILTSDDATIIYVVNFVNGRWIVKEASAS